VLDAFGPIGGHNFQWAWSTGRTAGRAAAAATWPTTHAPTRLRQGRSLLAVSW